MTRPKTLLGLIIVFTLGLWLPMTANGVVTLVEKGDGIAEWFTTEKNFGDYSAKLTIPIDATWDDAARVKVSYDKLLSTVTNANLKYWYFYDGVPHNSFVRLDIDADGNGIRDHCLISLKQDATVYNGIWTETIQTDSWQDYTVDEGTQVGTATGTWKTIAEWQAETATFPPLTTMVTYLFVMMGPTTVPSAQTDIMYIDDITIDGTTFAVEATPYKLVVTQEPSATADAGVDFVQQPKFEVRDSLDFLCSAYTGNVIVEARLEADTSQAGHGILRGTTTVAAVDGIATFTGLNYTKVEDIIIKATGSLPAYTNGISVVYGYLASIVFSPTSATVGVFGSVGLDATLTDSFANPAEGEDINFVVIQGAGDVDPVDETDASGTASTIFYASQYAGTEIVKGVWYDVAKQPDSVFSTVDIEVTPGPLAKVDATPADTVVVVSEDAIIVAELTDNWGNHLDATDINQVTFATSGLGTIGLKSLTDDKMIDMVYTTDDSMATDIITASIVGHSDLSNVHTIGGVPASMVLEAELDSSVVVSDTTDTDPANIEHITASLFDEYDNSSAYSDYYASPQEFYEVIFTVSAGGGIIAGDDTKPVDAAGECTAEYRSSKVAGTYTITGTSGAALDDIEITQTPDVLAGVVLTPDSSWIAAGMPLPLIAELQDQFENHINATDTTDVAFSIVDGDGSPGPRALEADSTVSYVYTAYEIEADTAHIKAVADIFEDIVVIFSAEPGALDHFALDPVPELDVPEYDTVVITAEDINKIRLYTWTNPDIVLLELSGSAADPSQVTWLISDDTTHYHGFNAMIPESTFVEGVCTVYVANEKAETDSVKASIPGEASGMSDPITWLPIDLYSFGVVAQEDSIFVDVPFSFTVTPYDTFMNVTPVDLPRWIEFSANESGVSIPVFQRFDATTVYSATASNPSDSLQITVVTMTMPLIYGISDDIIVYPPAGIPEDEALPIVYSLKAPDLGSKTIQYAVPERAPISISLFDKLGRRVGVLVDKTHDPGYYEVHLDRVRIPSGVYFIKMESPSFNSTKKMLLLK